MRKRMPILVCALMVGAAVAMAGCGTRAEVTNSPGAAAAVVRTSMMTVVRQQEELVKRLEAGNVTGARVSYLVLAEAFGQVLAPLSRTEPGLAQEMANANTVLKELLSQEEPDRAEVRKQAQMLLSALRRAADGAGVSLTGTAAGAVGTVGAHTVTPATKTVTPAAKSVTPAANTVTPAAKSGTGAAAERTIEVRAREYRFTPSTINVDKGTRVTIKLINEGTDKHEFELDAFRFEIRPIAPRTSAQGSFVADRTGVFEFACHVDGHYEKGMKGTLVVR